MSDQSDNKVGFATELLKAAAYAFKNQCSSEISIGKPFLWGAVPNAQVDICGSISVSSDVFCGSVMLVLSEKVFLGIMGKMFGQPFETMSEEIADGAGELLNMIFGTAKTALTNKGVGVKMALPATIRGQQIVLSMGEKGKAVGYPITGDFGQFYLLFYLQS